MKTTLEDIKRILLKHYEKTHGGRIDRQLLVVKAGEGLTKSVYFVLEGSPPKGYGIYVPVSGRLWLYDAEGKRFKIYSDVII